jgi:magnesium transporter
MGRKRRAKKPHRQVQGAPPGTLTAAPEAGETRLEIYRYDEKTCQSFKSLDEAVKEQAKLWINVEGLKDIEMIKSLGDRFDVHDLALEDVLYSGRPKGDTYGHHILVNLTMIHHDLSTHERLTVVLTRDAVLTFQGGAPGDPLGSVRERLRNAKGLVRSRGPDYLVYAILDSVVDAYFPLVDSWNEKLFLLEEELDHKPERSTAKQVREVRKDIIEIRRDLRQLREAIAIFQRPHPDLVSDENVRFFRDLYDLVQELLEFLDRQRELTRELLDAYQNQLSQATNEVMQTLTIISTIFIPLSFLAGIFGMNFNKDISPWNMPELNWYYGYPAALLLMTTVAGVSLTYFRRKGWLWTSGD